MKITKRMTMSGKEGYMMMCSTEHPCRAVRQCKTCKSNMFKDWYARNRERQKVRYKQYRDDRRQKVHNAYGNKCNWCWESDPLTLVIDHVENDGHVERKHTNHGQSTMLHLHIIRNNFPDKYQLLCANCNTAKQINKGELPKNRKNLYAPQ